NVSQKQHIALTMNASSSEIQTIKFISCCVASMPDQKVSMRFDYDFDCPNASPAVILIFPGVKYVKKN
ncbi:MAG: hypothetical protein K8F24_01160, partial [Bacteroidales bacterium]|nr:hypothetical protein [Bacteroidales bacterium]